jgi:hypothetical protein
VAVALHLPDATPRRTGSTALSPVLTPEPPSSPTSITIPTPIQRLPIPLHRS